MKIFVFPHHFPPFKGGIATYLFNIVNELTGVQVYVDYKNDCEVINNINHIKIIDFSKLGNGQALEDIIKILRKIKTIKDNRLRSKILATVLLMNRLEFWYIIRALSVSIRDICQSKNGKAILISGLAVPEGIICFIIKYMFGIEYLIFTHGFELLEIRKDLRRKFLFRTVLSHSRTVFANSKYTKNLLVDLGISSKTVHILHPCLPPIRTVKEDGSLRVRYQKILNAKHVLLTVANLVERKGQDNVIRALPSILKKHNNTLYLMIGEGEYRQYLEKLISDLNLKEHALILGTVSDKEKNFIYKHTDLFVMPGRKVGPHVEGFGISYIEANAFGIPVIASRIGGVEDAVIDGYTGYFVDPENVLEIVDIISQLLSNNKLLRKIGLQAKRWVKLNMNCRSQGKKFKTIINNAVIVK
jgi:phosphatidylinositol alpha-1,6-mannosyltransferase